MKKIISLICWLEVFFLWLCASSSFVNAAHTHKLMAILGLLFPFSVVLILLTALVCLFVARKQLLILALGLGSCYHALSDYFPINLGTSIPEDNYLKVMSYNTLSLGNYETDEAGEFVIAHYIGAENPHIACLQEAGFRHEEDQNSLVATMKKYGYSYKWLQVGNSDIGVASKFPIVKEEKVYESGGNGAAAFYLLPPGEDTLLVINAHMESMHLSATDRDQYHTLVKNLTHADTIKGKKTILSKIANAGVERAQQADTLAQYIDRMAGKRIILTGDFNDTPISYAHHQVCSRLTDAFKTAGNGLGRSFNKDAIIVRIDNIFCSSHWIPQYTYIDNQVNYSDHYPIVSYLQVNEKR